MAAKTFKIEKQLISETGMPADSSVQQCNQLMTAIGEVKELLTENSVPTQMPEQILEDFRADMAEAARIRIELATIQKAIDATKQQIAGLGMRGEETPDINRMSNELGAIVEGTESATETILASAEQIDERATDLIAALKGVERDQAADIQEQIVKIFEACNFQDLTGQRISKVIKAFGFIENRVDKMMEIWGGIESFKGFEPEQIKDNGTGHHLLNGPALEADNDVANQDDIDALFD